jgi:hypothetical protein
MGGEEERNEHGASLEVQIAISLWVQSRMAKKANPNPKVVELMPLMFKTLDAMYLETRNLPFFARSGATGRPKNNPDSFIFGLWLKDADYVTLRSILALAGDLIYVLEKLMTLPGLLELGQFMTPPYKQANQFRDARDFFTHMDEALRDHSKHGISGPATLECGVQFTANAKNNVYVIWDKNTLYFSFENKQRKVVIDKPEFDEIFNQARELYAEIINNPTSQQSGHVRKPDQVYPLN